MEGITLQAIVIGVLVSVVLPLAYVFVSKWQNKALNEARRLEAQLIKTEAQRNALRALADDVVTLAEVYGLTGVIADKQAWAIKWLQERLDADGIDIEVAEVVEAIQAAWARMVAAQRSKQSIRKEDTER